jgi:transposase InsO family protein
LICKAMIKAVNLRQPPQGLVFHSDRGSQYTSKRFGKLLKGLCYEHQWVMLTLTGRIERFFGSLKHDWIFKVAQPTRDHMKSDVAAYIQYYNLDGYTPLTVAYRRLTLKRLKRKCPVLLDQYRLQQKHKNSNINMKLFYKLLCQAKIATPQPPWRQLHD